MPIAHAPQLGYQLGFEEGFGLGGHARLHKMGKDRERRNYCAVSETSTNSFLSTPFCSASFSFRVTL